jgi:hypothetical protein
LDVNLGRVERLAHVSQKRANVGHQLFHPLHEIHRPFFSDACLVLLYSQLQPCRCSSGALFSAGGWLSAFEVSGFSPPPPMVCKFLKTKKTLRKILDAWELRAKS